MNIKTELIEMGFSPKYEGTIYLIDLYELVKDYKLYKLNTTKDFFSCIAEKNNKTVEAIHSAIRVALLKADKEKLNKYFNSVNVTPRDLINFFKYKNR